MILSRFVALSVSLVLKASLLQGVEASHKHSLDDLGCDRGYEWFLVEEARKRNPKIATCRSSNGSGPAISPRGRLTQTVAANRRPALGVPVPV